MKRIATSAAFVETLVYFDGPQLLALNSDRGFKMLAVAVRHEGIKRAFFSCELRDNIVERYFEEKVDLHYAFSQAIGRSYYFFGFASADRTNVSLTWASEESLKNSNIWPAPGIFADDHQNPFDRGIIPDTTTRTFNIDGNWEASDFSRFQNKMSEIYALFASVDRFSGPIGSAEKGYLQNEITHRYWQGGGSYGGFFDSLETRNTLVTRSPLRVDAINYASPGTIVFRGNDGALSAIESLMDIFEERHDELMNRYRFIYGVLRKEGLLSARRNSSFSSRAIRDMVRDRVREFAGRLALDRVDEMYELSGRNILVFAKVVLSIFRRAEAVYQFHAEGRVQSAVRETASS